MRGLHQFFWWSISFSLQFGIYIIPVGHGRSLRRCLVLDIMRIFHYRCTGHARITISIGLRLGTAVGNKLRTWAQTLAAWMKTRVRYKLWIRIVILFVASKNLRYLDLDCVNHKLGTSTTFYTSFFMRSEIANGSLWRSSKSEPSALSSSSIGSSLSMSSAAKTAASPSSSSDANPASSRVE